MFCLLSDRRTFWDFPIIAELQHRHSAIYRTVRLSVVENDLVSERNYTLTPTQNPQMKVSYKNGDIPEETFIIPTTFNARSIFKSDSGKQSTKLVDFPSGRQTNEVLGIS